MTDQTPETEPTDQTPVTEPTTTLPAFEEDVTLPTPPAPEPVYPLPHESLLDVRYTRTANHYWTFRDSEKESWIVDQAPLQNPLSEAVYARFQASDRKLTQPGPVFDDLNNPQESIFVALSSSSGKPPDIILGDALEPINPRSVVLDPSTGQCLKLVKSLQEERFYLRQCLLSADSCDYGLSLSVWLRFLVSNATAKEVILATGPKNARGFQLYLRADRLRFELWTSRIKWSIEAPFNKPTQEWINIAVTWGKSTQMLQLFINRHLVAQKTNYLGEEYFGDNVDPTGIWLGCETRDDEKPIIESSTLGVQISTVTLWYWPVQLNQILTGGLEMFLLEPSIKTTTTLPPPPPSDFVDYTHEVEEFVPLADQDYPPNPMYAAADLYIPMQASLNTVEWKKVAREQATERNRFAYRLLSKESYVKLHSFEPNTCPTALNTCRNGLSVGMWMNIPITLNAHETALDILEMVDAFRISIFKQTINIFVTIQGSTSAFRVVEISPRDIWFNLGLSFLTRNTKLTMSAYFNGLKMHVVEVNVPPKRNISNPEQFKQMLLFGSQAVGYGAADVSANDLIIWYRSLNDFEGHRFLGYERSQLDQLLHSSYYWTLDLYVFRDSASQMQMRRKYNYSTSVESISETGVASYSLASIYKPRGIKFRFSTKDYMEKSPVPIFDMRLNQYMLLGRRKSPEHSTSDLVWTKQCLLDPTDSICGLRGFTLSFWIKIVSVSENRLRFYLNSGDPGTGGLTFTDNRGVAIFTDSSLLGVSISQRFTTWKLILDSSSYTLGQWINIGILWREDVGLTLLLDGVNFGTTDIKGSKVYKPRVASPYVILGRFNEDDKSKWLSPIEAETMYQQSNGQNNPGWEMANYALGEVTYFNKLLSQEEYNTQMGLLGVPRFRGFTGDLWYGKNLIDAPIEQLTAAAELNLTRPGPVLSENPYSAVNLIEQPAAAQLFNGSSLRLGVFGPEHCTRKKPFCPEGLSIGAWIRIGDLSVTRSKDLTILFTGAGGKFGMAVSSNGEELGVWMVDQSNEWFCVMNDFELKKSTMYMQWIHYSFIWGPSSGRAEFQLRIVINGKQRQVCPKDKPEEATIDWFKLAKETAQKLYQDTETKESAYLLVSSSVSIGQVIVALVAMKPTTVVGPNLMDLIGVEYSQFLTMQISTFYWPFSGIIKQLTPHRLTPVRITYTQDKQDTVMGAMCTDGTNQSFVALKGDSINRYGRTNLESSCLVNPTTCESYVFTMEYYHVNLPSEPGTGRELFRSTPLEAPENTVGLRIVLSDDAKRLIVIARNEVYTLINSVEIGNLTESHKWIKLEVFYTVNGIKIRNAGIQLASTKDTTKQWETNRPLTSEEGQSLRLTVGRGLAVCVSDVSTLDVPKGEDAESFISGGSATYCYPETDFLEELQGTQPDHLGLSNAATDLQVLVERLLIHDKACLYEPSQCSSITVSLWARIDGFVEENQKPTSSYASEKMAVLFSTGPPARRGISIILYEPVDKGGGTLGLRAIVRTDAELWQVESPQVVLPGEWINIGIHWYQSDELRSSGFEIYLNGLRQQSSTLPREKFKYPASDSSNVGLYFSKAYVKQADAAESLKHYTLRGLVDHFAFWSSTTISCSRPRSTKQKLLGECSIDRSVPESVLCTILRDCMQADGAVCLDPTLSNLYRMATQAAWLSDPGDFQRLLSVALKLGDDNIFELESNTSALQSKHDYVFSVSKILRAWSPALQKSCEFFPSKTCTTIKQTKVQIVQLLIQIGAAVTNYKFEEAWEDLLAQGSCTPSDIITAVSNVIQSVTGQLNKPTMCEERLESFTENGSATMLAVNIVSSCPSQSISLMAHSLLAPEELGSAMFETTYNLLTSDDQKKGVLSLIGIPAPNDEAKYVAGGLPRDRFAPHALEGSPEPWKLSDPVKALRKQATKLRIKSPVYVFSADVEGSTTLANFNVSFVIQLAGQNEFEDVHIFRTTGRKKWKAVETITKHELHGGQNLTLAFPVRCVYCETDANNNEARWNDEGCEPVDANLTHVHCTCTHLSAFAIAMEPTDAPGRKRSIWITWGIETEEEHYHVLKILLLTTNAISLACSIAFLSTVVSYIVRSTFQDIYIIHGALCVALIIFHSAWLAEPFVETSEFGCRLVGVTVHASAMLIASWLFCETVALFRCFVLGDFSSKRFWTWFFGLVTPAVIVILPTGLTKMQSHGEDLLCLPARESYVFWTMFGTIFVYYFLAILVCLIIGCNIETPAYLKPKLIEKLIQRASHLNFLTFYSAISWVGVISVIMIPIPYVPYAAFTATSLLGTFSFLLLDLGDVDLRKFYCGRYSDYSRTKKDENDSKSTFRTDQHNFPQQEVICEFKEEFKPIEQVPEPEVSDETNAHKRQLKSDELY